MQQVFLRTLILTLFLSFLASCQKDDNKDTVKPWIELKGFNPVYTPLNEPYVDSGAVAWDVNAYGDTVNISDRLVITNNVNTAEIGKYVVRYNVEDEAGNKAEEVTRTVYVQIF